jgi:hypothetical protein
MNSEKMNFSRLGGLCLKILAWKWIFIRSGVRRWSGVMVGTAIAQLKLLRCCADGSRSCRSPELVNKVKHYANHLLILLWIAVSYNLCLSITLSSRFYIRLQLGITPTCYALPLNPLSSCAWFARYTANQSLFHIPWKVRTHEVFSHSARPDCERLGDGRRCPWLDGAHALLWTREDLKDF